MLHKFSVDLPKKHGRGGQSALRFARLRLEKRHNYVRKVYTQHMRAGERGHDKRAQVRGRGVFFLARVLKSKCLFGRGILERQTKD